MKINNNFKHERCPFCSSSNIYLVDSIEIPSHTMFSTTEIYLQNRPELWACNNCRSYFTQTVIPENIARKIYSESDSGLRWSQLPFCEQKPKEILKALDQWFKPGARVLDIGCNTGELLDYAKSRGCVTTGIEYSETSQQTLENKGHMVYCSMNALQGTYNVITAFDLLEHLYAPRDFLLKCAEALEDNGVCIILTGNIESISSRLTGSKWWYLQYPEHIAFPSKKFLSQFSGMKLHSIVSTYASKAYWSSFWRVIRSATPLVLRRKYTGLPSVGPDHFLAVLTK